MTFPDNCIRGVPNNDFVIADGSVASHLFNPKRQNENQRDDGWNETSINWEDDGDAITFTLEIRKDDNTYQYEIGVVRIPRQEIDRINSHPTTIGLLSYERQPLMENPYHGNILFRQGIPTPKVRQLAASLATIASRIINRE
jgi:hypothetical protein